MSSRKRSVRSNRSRKPRRSLPPLLEGLENRMVLSQVESDPPGHRADLGPGRRAAADALPVTPAWRKADAREHS